MALNDLDIATIKGMLARGDRAEDIATYFGTQRARIREIGEGDCGAHIAATANEALPPPGPYVTGRSALKALDTLIAVRLMIDQAMDEMDVYERVVLRDNDGQCG